MRFQDLGLQPTDKTKKKGPFTPTELLAFEASEHAAELAELEALKEAEASMHVPDLHDAKELANKVFPPVKLDPVEAKPESVAFLAAFQAAMELYPAWGPDNLKRAFEICGQRFHSFFIYNTTADTDINQWSQALISRTWTPEQQVDGS